MHGLLLYLDQKLGRINRGWKNLQHVPVARALQYREGFDGNSTGL